METQEKYDEYGLEAWYKKFSGMYESLTEKGSIQELKGLQVSVQGFATISETTDPSYAPKYQELAQKIKGTIEELETSS